MNPLLQQSERLYKKPEMGDSFSIAGIDMVVEKDGGVDVPKHMVGALKSHGFMTEAEKREQDKTERTAARAKVTQ